MVLDNGKFGASPTCPPKLLIFNLSNNRLIKRIIIPNRVSTDSNGEGLLITPIMQTRNCESWDANVSIKILF